MPQTETLEFAQYYESLGLHCIPLKPKDKLPAISWKKWQKERADVAQLGKWFGNGHNYNIGLVLGRGLIAVDIDGPEGEQALIDAGITLPDNAPVSITARGRHVFLRVRKDYGDRIGLLLKVDIRGLGYVVVPPSTHSTGHVYQWETRISAEVPFAPESLEKLLQSSNAVKEEDAAPKWVATTLAGVAEGGRDAACARLAGYFLSKGLPNDIVKAQLYSFARACKPEFPQSDVDKCVASITRKRMDNANEPFQHLGHDQGELFFLAAGSNQVTSFRTESINKGKLMAVAPLPYWETSYTGKNGVKWDSAIMATIAKSHAAGIYDPNRVRGRGAWWDEGKPILHLGDSIVSDGRRIPIGSPGRYIYQNAKTIEIEYDNPLSCAEANSFITISEMLSWEDSISARLFAGWIVCAPICGALSWRPHIWITGASGAGKSYVVNHIMRPMLGSIGLAVQGETTEAGLRQTLGMDARPVIFDEAEGHNERAQNRIQTVLGLMRQASSGDGADIVKGTSIGIARSARIQSCFALSSIGVGVKQHADANRVSVLSLIKSGDTGKFAAIKQSVEETISQEYVKRFIARSIRMIPTIRANSEVFSHAVANKLGSQRMGDQIGALLAGAYSLYEDNIISPKDAREFVEAEQWDDQKNIGEDTDESGCFEHLLTHIVRVQFRSFSGDRNIGEIAAVASGRKLDSFSEAEANDILMRYGMKSEGRNSLIISSSHPAVGRILNNTHWATAWSRTLKRIAGACATNGPVRFGEHKSRGVIVPLT